MAIITKEPFSSPKLYKYPQPDFDLFFRNGSSAIKHCKAVQIVGYKSTYIANTHPLPLIVFGHDYQEGAGKKLGEQIQTILLQHLEPPLVLCGDFGMPNKHEYALEKLTNQLKLQNALPLRPTYHKKSEVTGLNAPDRIYITADRLQRGKSDIVNTETDHYLCWADITSKN